MHHQIALTPARRSGLVRSLAAAVLAGVVLLSAAHPLHAASPRYLGLNDYTDRVNVTDVSGSAAGSVAGVTYAHAIELSFARATASIFTRAFPGYDAVQFDVGLSDSGQFTGDTGELLVSVDGVTVKDLRLTYGHQASHVVIPFAKASTITLTVGPATAKKLVIGNPTLRPVAVAQQGPTGAKLTVQAFSRSVSAGGQETLLVTTRALTMLTIVIVYPDSSQRVVGPRQADADGHLADTWSVPAAVTGTCHVVVIGASVVQTTFSIG